MKASAQGTSTTGVSVVWRSVGLRRSRQIGAGEKDRTPLGAEGRRRIFKYQDIICIIMPVTTVDIGICSH